METTATSPAPAPSHGPDHERRPGRARALVALATALLLAGVAAPRLVRGVDPADLAAVERDLDELGDAILRYRLDTGVWPADGNLDPESSDTWCRFGFLQGLACLYSDVHREEGWRGPYLERSVKEAGRHVVSSRSADPDGFVDPWSRRYHLGYSGAAGPLGAAGGVYLLCTGPNGKIDTTNRDVAAGRRGGDDQLRVVQADR